MEIIETNFLFNSNHTMRSLDKINRIILHHSASETASPEDIDRWHKARGFAGAGYQFLVRKDGSVYSLRPVEMVGAHATGFNTCSIGVCFEGNFMNETMEDIQKQAGKELVAYLKDKYGLILVQKHKDVNATACPGANFPFEDIANSNEVPHIEENNVVSTNYKDYVENYQKAYNSVYEPNIEADGIYGAETDGSKYKVCLKRGARNELVRWCQDRLLNHKGYTISVDGIFGTETERTVKQFQLDNGLTADGIIGIKTLTLLF